MRLLLIPAVLAVSACRLMGYPGGAPPAPPAASTSGGGATSSAPRTPVPAIREETPTDAEVAAIPDAVPVPEPPSRYGNPTEYEVNGVTYRVLEGSEGYEAEGLASWYGSDFHGRRTSSGEPYDMYAMTAAHRSLPLPTYVEVTNLENGEVVVLRVNDRGPFHEGRIIDVSYVAARKLGLVGPGTARVRVRALEPAGG